MVKDDFVGFKIERDLKKSAKKYAVLESRTLSSFITQAIKEKIKAIQETERTG